MTAETVTPPLTAEADGIYADTRVIERIVSVTEGAR